MGTKKARPERERAFFMSGPDSKEMVDLDVERRGDGGGAGRSRIDTIRGNGTVLGRKGFGNTSKKVMKSAE
jgi:hypothetical protein